MPTANCLTVRPGLNALAPLGRRMTVEKTKDQITKEVIADMQAEQRAFDEAGIKYGTAAFTHSCGGKATATREYTPWNIAHKVSVYGHCEKCGSTWMN